MGEGVGYVRNGVRVDSGNVPEAHLLLCEFNVAHAVVQLLADSFIVLEEHDALDHVYVSGANLLAENLLVELSADGQEVSYPAVVLFVGVQALNKVRLLLHREFCHAILVREVVLEECQHRKLVLALQRV